MDLRVLGMKSKRDVWCAVVSGLVAIFLPQLIVIPGYAMGLRDSVAGYDAALVQALSFTLLKVTAGHLVLLGLPVFLWLYHRDLLTWQALGGAGYVVGLLAGLFWAFFDFTRPEFMSVWTCVWFWSGMGAFLGASFWVVWRLLHRY